MHPKILNIIIVVSLLGMLFVTIRDTFYPPKQSEIVASELVSPTISNKVASVAKTHIDPEIPCKNEYFNFSKGTTWRYKLSTGAIFTSTVTSSSGSVVTISTKLPTVKEPAISTLTCRKSGVYGLPFIPISSKSIPKNITDSIMLIPNASILQKGSEWTSTIDLGIQGITVKSNVEKITDQTIDVASTLDLGAIPANLSPVGNGKILEYTLTKGIGISTLKFLIGKDGKTSSGFDVTLVGYSL